MGTRQWGDRSLSELIGLRDDVYRRPLATALPPARASSPGWRCVDVGAGGGDVSVALAEMVGRDGRVYAVDSDPRSPATRWLMPPPPPYTQVVALTQAGEDLILPEQVDLAFCRFLLLHVVDPAVVVRLAWRPRSGPGAGWWPRSRTRRAGRIGGAALSMPDARHPESAGLLPALVRDAGLEVVDAWAEAPAESAPVPSPVTSRRHRG